MLLLPLSHPQKRVWVIENLYPKSSLYNIGGAFYFTQVMDLVLLEESIEQIIFNNANMRIRLKEHSGEIFQYVDESEHKVPLLDFMKMDIESREWFRNHFNKPFEMLEHPLFDFMVFIDRNGQMGCYFKAHHIICDGWSIKLVAEKVVETYQSKIFGKEIKYEQLDYSYYLDKERKYENSSRFLKDKEFWLERFSDLSHITYSKSSDRTEAKRLTSIIIPERSQRIRNYTQEYSITIAAFFTSVMFIYLSKMNKSDEIVVGTPIFNRFGHKEKATFGMFTSTMPLKINVSQELTNMEFMLQVNKELSQYYSHQKYPYDTLVDDIMLKKQGLDQLFQYCINYSNAALPERCHDIDIETLDFFSGHQIYSLQVFVKDWYEDGSIRLDFEYKIRDYTAFQIQQLEQTFNYLIDQITLEPDKIVKDVRLVEPKYEDKILYEWNRTEDVTEKSSSIVELFYRQAALEPDQIALEKDGEFWTYDELNQRSNALARLLQRKGLGPEDIIAINAVHSLEAIMAMWAVLKAGAAFLPIDPGLPSERIKFMIKDSNVNAIITNLDNISIYENEIEIIKISSEDFFTKDIENLECLPEKSQLAYIIYTSGSTGSPKGVMIEHGGLLNYISWACSTYVKGREVFPVYSSFSFDLTLTSIFTPLVCGSKAMIYPESSDEFVLDKILTENYSTVIKLTPSHLKLMIENKISNSSVNTLIVGGEDLKAQLAQDALEHYKGMIQIFNEYGPTETVVGCMIHLYKEDEVNHPSGSVSIGRPIQNMKVYVLDENLHTVPFMSKGELYISGAGVARGYLNRRDMTQEKFVENPFIHDSLMYKTGDIAYLDEKGNMFYVGRADDQIKINGYRIETLEIENVLCKLAGVRDSVVVKYSAPNGMDMLIAYVELSEEISVMQMKKSLSLLLPNYMVPSHFEILDQFPVTLNGKIDRLKLPEPVFLIPEEENFNSFTVNEVLLAVKEVLRVEEISLNDNFFFIGGDSIKAIQISSILKLQGIELKARDILLFPIIREFSGMVTKNQPTTRIEDPIFSEGYIPNSPIINWFLKRNLKNKNHYLQSVHLKLKREITYEQLCLAMSYLIDSHDSLRITFDEKRLLLKYQDKSVRSTIKYVDLREKNMSEIAEEIYQVDKQVKKNISMSGTSLFYPIYYDTSDGALISLIAHHLIMDGVSWRIILEDLNLFLSGIIQHQIHEASKSSSYKLWITELLKYAQSASLHADKKYWANVVSEIHYVKISEQKKYNTLTPSSLVLEQQIIEADVTGRILTKVNEGMKTESKELVVAAIVLTLVEMSQEKYVSLLLEGHGREQFDETFDISHTVGWFTSIYPASFSIESDVLEEQVVSVSKQLRTIPLNGIGYGMQYYLQNLSGVDENKLIRLNYLGEMDNGLENTFFSISNMNYSPDVCPSNDLNCLMDINIYIEKRRFVVNLTYNRELFSKETIDQFFRVFNCKLTEISQIGVTASSEDIVDLTEHKLNQEDMDILFS